MSKHHASGAFEVTLNPLSAYNEDPDFGRRSIDKVYLGGLEAISKGEMLSVMGGVTGSAVYVAAERVTGLLNGQRGSFVLHHTGVMNRGKPSLTIQVAPDSGVDALNGITGAMSIVIENDKHFYTFDYELPD